MRSNRVVIAAAGSRKTQAIIDWALESAAQRVLITTYTRENQNQIEARILAATGLMPAYISIMGWFEFLIRECIKPYQVSITGQPNLIGGLNFEGSRNRYTPASDWKRYYLDSRDDIYREGAARLACEVNNKSSGASIRRLERAYGHILIDEVQDLVAYDLDWMNELLSSQVKVTAVGDPRQHMFATSNEPRNKRYRGIGIVDWFSERSKICNIESRTQSYRCNQLICKFADSLYPNLERTQSIGVQETEHDGLFLVPSGSAQRYFDAFQPKVLRHSKRANTYGLPAMNIGLSKGSTFDRVLVIPTQPMLDYLRSGVVQRLKAPQSLYVAVTRARYSVAFVVPKDLVLRGPQCVGCPSIGEWGFE